MPTVTRLSEITTQMQSLWPYGDKDFGYTFEVNEKHNTQYPYMLINPPNSEMPEIYGGWESYDFVIDFFDTYNTSNREAVSLDKEWDNLQDFALEWFDNLMNVYNNPGGPNVNVYFLEETLNFERVKEVANDRLVQVKMFFTLRAVTRCMVGNTPLNYYPNRISDLAIWLSADANITEEIATKLVSGWGDRSGNGNDVAQQTKGKRPKRYTYDVLDTYAASFNEKARINFYNTASAGGYSFKSIQNLPISGNDFTIFAVTNATLSLLTFQKFFGYKNITTNAEIEVGFFGGSFRAVVKDKNGNSIVVNNAADPLQDSISAIKLSRDTLSISVNNSIDVSSTTVGFDATGEYNDYAFGIGGSIDGALGTFYEGALAEIIVYNRDLTALETTRIYNYLNNKYKIY